MIKNTLWHETLHDKFGQYFNIDNVLYHTQTDHQDLIIFKNAAFGRVMALDGVLQTTERDEFIYHEMMTHVPLLAHGHAKHVLIIGGGDGAMLREVSSHKNIDTITMVEIDAAVVALCRQYLPNHNAGTYDDSRFRLVIDDGVNFVNHTTQMFDVIIADSTDPIGPGESLFTLAFYEGCKRCLNPDGIFVAQNGVCFLQQTQIINSYCKLSNYFSDVSFYQAAIPTYYGGIMTFAWATDNSALRHLPIKIIQANFQRANLTCRYYHPVIHTAAFAIPQYLHDMLVTPLRPKEKIKN